MITAILINSVYNNILQHSHIQVYTYIYIYYRQLSKDGDHQPSLFFNAWTSHAACPGIGNSVPISRFILFAIYALVLGHIHVDISTSSILLNLPPLNNVGTFAWLKKKFWIMPAVLDWTENKYTNRHKLGIGLTDRVRVRVNVPKTSLLRSLGSS